MRFDLKENIVSLAGACFWYWNSYYRFIDSCGVQESLYIRYPKDSFNKYQVMHNVLEWLEEQGKDEIINNIISNFYRLRNAVDKENLDNNKAKQLLAEFR